MKYRLRISFDLPVDTDPKVVSVLIHKTFMVTQKLVRGELDFRMSEDHELGRLAIIVQSSKILPEVDTLKIRLPELQHLEIVDASVN